MVPETTHLLDRPVWSALNTNWATLAQGDARAWRLDPDYGPFAATDGTAAGAEALWALLPADRDTWLVEPHIPPLPPGMAHREAVLVQMVATAPIEAPDAAGARQLVETDGAEMRALAVLTAPGPFLAKTHRIGDFIGVHDGGRLMAMAGTRMRMPGFAEVSGVCTHPDARGRGHAARLSRLVAARLQGQGLVPILHAYPGNSAVRMYAALGFGVRQELRLVVLGSGPQMQKAIPDDPEWPLQTRREA
ncbi:MAG: GNAT family N-acetyltransferase [Sandarakinorhabdus sp.]|nr:GNAT family N-acetyltransferase [Sandarakinorhabdus sp.]